MDKFILNFVDLHIEWYTRNNNVSYERRNDRRIETIDLNSSNPYLFILVIFIKYIMKMM